MSNVKNLKHFPPGKSGNLAGRPKLSLSKKQAASLADDSLLRIADLIFNNSVKECRSKVKRKLDQISPAEYLFVTQILKGNIKAFEMLIQRTIGSIKDEEKGAGVYKFSDLLEAMKKVSSNEEK